MMGLKVNCIVTLENLRMYLVLSETMYRGRKYFLVMGMHENREINTDDVGIFEEQMEGLDTYVLKIVEPELIITLTNLFKESN